MSDKNDGQYPSEEAKRLIKKSIDDPMFTDKLRHNPEAALDEFDLTDEEREAIERGDPRKIREMIKGSSDAEAAIIVILALTTPVEPYES